jgi:hypothetical protein
MHTSTKDKWARNIASCIMFTIYAGIIWIAVWLFAEAYIPGKGDRWLLLLMVNIIAYLGLVLGRVDQALETKRKQNASH